MTALVLWLAGCRGLEGVWYFEISWRPVDDPPCTGSVDHDFLGAGQPATGDTGADDPWSSTVTETWSPESFYGLVTEMDGDPMLQAFDLLLPGAYDEATGAWSFLWAYEDRVEQRDSHAAGYAYEGDELDRRQEGLVGRFDGDAFEGNWEEETTYEGDWSESDTWSAEVEAIVGTVGRIPAGDWLVVGDPADPQPATNTSAEVECADASCVLSVRTTCTVAYEAVGWRTDLDVAEFEVVRDAGNDAGL